MKQSIPLETDNSSETASKPVITVINSPSALNVIDEEKQIMYNRVWGTNEPPPLPTFDEDDENIW